MGSHHNVQVAPLEASYVMIPWAPPGTLTVLLTLTDLGDTEDHKSSLSEIEHSLIISLWESILQKKNQHKLQPLIYFFFSILLFESSRCNEKKNHFFISDAMLAILDNTVKKRTTAFYMWFQVQYDSSMS